MQKHGFLNKNTGVAIISASKSCKLNELTNEELVFMIQEDMNNQEYWNILWEKTEKVVYSVYHKKVHRYYKENMAEDIIAILNTGWFHAVKTYNKEKATGPFHSYASFIIEQKYCQFLRKIKDDRIGKSVRCEFLNDIKLPTSFADCNNTIDFCIVNILEDVNSNNAFEEIEKKDYINSKLKQLEEVLPTSYLYIIETIYNNKTQNQIAKEYNVPRHTVSKAIKKGYNWLREEYQQDEIELERLEECYNNKYNKIN